MKNTFRFIGPSWIRNIDYVWNYQWLLDLPCFFMNKKLEKNLLWQKLSMISSSSSSICTICSFPLKNSASSRFPKASKNIEISIPVSQSSLFDVVLLDIFPLINAYSHMPSLIEEYSYTSKIFEMLPPMLNIKWFVCCKRIIFRNVFPYVQRDNDRLIR